MKKTQMWLYIDCAFLLLSVTIGTYFRNAVNKTMANGLPDEKGNTLRKFEHVFFGVIIMFLGESLCLLCFYFEKIFKRHSIKIEDSYLRKKQKTNDFHAKLLLAIPTISDQISTILRFLVLWLSVSMSGMLRAVNIIFIAIFAWLIFKVQLSKFNWAGVGLVSLGVFTIVIGVILKSFFKDPSKNNQLTEPMKLIYGVILLLLGYAGYSFKAILEEIILKKKKISPSEVVGIEGIYGLFLSILTLIAVNYIPGKYPTNHRIEDTYDTFVMLSNSPFHLVACILDCLLLFTYNFFSMRVTKRLSAIHATFVCIFGSLLTWLVELSLFYFYGNKKFGCEFDRYDIFNVFGYVFCFSGAVIFNKDTWA